MRKLRVLVLMHAALVPPDSLEGHSAEEINQWKMEYDVLAALHNLGHRVQVVPVEDDLKPIRDALNEFKPHVAFNLLMHFHDSGVYDSAIVSWLELRKQHYSGCNPRGLLVANDKTLCKKVLSYHRIRHPRFLTVPRGRSVSRLPKGLSFPLFVKSSSEHASTGIAHASIVNDIQQLRERVEFVHRSVGTGALCEEYIEGRELTIGVIGNQRLETAPVWEVFMDKLPDGVPNIFTSRVKWNLDYQKQIGLRTDPATDLPPGKAEKIDRVARRIYRALGLSGFARIDIRMDAEGRVWILEVNPNPDLCYGEDFAEAFERVGYSYSDLVQKLLNLGLRYEAPWKG
jgi:D-alanine-D-alanine ligase